MQRTMRQGIALSIGLTVGLVLFRLMSLVVGLALMSCAGLLMSGHWVLAMLIACSGFLLYTGMRYLLFRSLSWT